MREKGPEIRPKTLHSRTLAGRITLTDPDFIENSNLSRQFLFRERHLRKSKSATAGAAAVAMNPALAGRVFPFQEFVKPETEHTFSDAFFARTDCVARPTPPRTPPFLCVPLCASAHS